MFDQHKGKNDGSVGVGVWGSGWGRHMDAAVAMVMLSSGYQLMLFQRDGGRGFPMEDNMCIGRVSQALHC